MKQTFLSILLLFAVLFSSCSQNPAVNDLTEKVRDYRTKEYFINVSQQTDPSLADGIIRLVDYAYEITDGVVPGIERSRRAENIREGGSFTFLDKSYPIGYYEETFYYRHNGVKADKYFVQGGSIMLTENGELLSIQFPVLKLDIQSTDSAEAVRKAAEKAFEKEIDFSAFRYCDDSAKEEEKTENDRYSFTWYNVKGAYMTRDYMTLDVLPDGTVDNIWMYQRTGHSFDDIPNDISIEPYLPRIEQKLKQVYRDPEKKTELKSFRFMNVYISDYEGRHCFDCQIGVHYTHGNNALLWSDVCELLVPLDPVNP